MKKVQFAGTELCVAPLGLGTVNFGTSLAEMDAMRQLDRFVELGNLIDTAHIYGDWVPGETARSERVIGRWLKARGGRDRVVISTKGAHPRLETMQVSRVVPEEIVRDLEESLECLETDYIDMYFLHRDNLAMPVGEILECLETQRRAGKIRYYGCSNWKLPRIQEAKAYADAHGLQGFTCNQLMWSLAEINFDGLSDKSFVLMDAPTYAHHKETALGAMAYMSIANGYFSHRRRNDVLKPSVQAVYHTQENERIFSALCALEERFGLSMMELSLLYFNAQPFATVPLASFRTEAQLEEAISVFKCDPPQEVQEVLSALRTDL